MKMDLFEKYFKELMAGVDKTPWHTNMEALTAAATMLNYSENHHRTLRYLAKLLWKMGFYGESYRASLTLPAEEGFRLCTCGFVAYVSLSPRSVL